MDNKLKEILLRVEKPARYVGGEFNMPDMNKPCSTRLCLCFPEIYEMAMSNIGIRILYHMLNDMEGIVCERCFAPFVDMGEQLRTNNIPLFSIDTGKPLKEFDIVGMSIGYELLYTNVLYMLDLAGIPFRASDRGEEYPILIAGGPCVVNPEPFAELFDAVLIGEGEKNLKEFTLLYDECKKQGLSKKEFLNRAVSLDGVYMPSIVQPIYSENQIPTNEKSKEYLSKVTIDTENNSQEVSTAQDKPVQTHLDKGKGNNIIGFTSTVKKAVVQDLDKAYFPTKILVPNIEITHDRAVLELYRGCNNGCRFCQACFYYRPIRSRKLNTLLEYGKQLVENTGYSELSLSSLSTSDYYALHELITGLKASVCNGDVRLAMPSLRLDTYKPEYMASGRLGSLTFAPEAGTQRLRNVINKNISEENIQNTIRYALETGYTGFKLYFMIGLPTETEEDLQGIVDIVLLIKDMAKQYSKSKRPVQITVSTSVFIPKPLTPFQWERQISLDEMLAKQKFLIDNLHIKNVRYNWHDAKGSILEAVLSRGDRRLLSVIEKAYSLGCKFDGWSERFDFSKWQQAFEECGISIDDYTREWHEEEVLPWDFVEHGVSKKYLLKERHNAYKGVTTSACSAKKCSNCGANKLGRCFNESN